jgi:hypothetical protein
LALVELALLLVGQAVLTQFFQLLHQRVADVVLALLLLHKTAVRVVEQLLLIQQREQVQQDKATQVVLVLVHRLTTQQAAVEQAQLV